MLKEFHRVRRDTVIVAVWIDAHFKGRRADTQGVPARPLASKAAAQGRLVFAYQAFLAVWQAFSLKLLFSGCAENAGGDIYCAPFFKGEPCGHRYSLDSRQR